MSEYMIKEDRKRLLLYTLSNLIFTCFLLILAAGFYSTGAFLLAFFAITGLWFSVKAMLKYGSKCIKKTPVCVFNKDEVIIHFLPGEPRALQYKDISEVKMLRDMKSLKLFFASDKVEHPSGWYYAGVIYPFQRAQLDNIEKETTDFLEQHHVEVRKVERKK